MRNRPALALLGCWLAGHALGSGRFPGALLAGAVVCLALRNAPGEAGRWRWGILALVLAGVGWAQAPREAGSDPGRTGLEGEVRGFVLRAPSPRPDGGLDLEVRVESARPQALADPGEHIRLRTPPAVEDGDGLLRLRRGDPVAAWGRRGSAGRSPSPRTPLLWVKSRRLVERGSGGASGRILRRLDGLRPAARARLMAALPPADDATQLVRAMLLGEREGLRGSVRARMRDAGMLHFIALSGLHVGLLLAGLAWILLLAGAGHRSSRGVLACALAALPSVVGARAPVLRASASTGLALAGRALGRRAEPLNSLALVALVLLLWRPGWLATAAFQLTTVVTASILIGAPRLAPWLPGPRWLRLAAAVALAAHAGGAPLSAIHFGRVAAASIPASLAATPLCAGVVGAGLLGLAIPWAGDVFLLPLAHLAAQGMLVVADAAGSLPGGSVRATPPSPGILALGVAGCVLWLAPDSRGERTSSAAHRRCRRAGVTAILLFQAAIHVGPPPGAGGQGVRVAIPDLGRAQSVILPVGGGRCVVMDAGGGAPFPDDHGERRVALLLDRLGCRRIPVLVLSHAHRDHAGGARSLLAGYPVEEVWMSTGGVDDWPPELAAPAPGLGVAWRGVRRGDRILRSWGSLEVLHPEPRSDMDLDTNNRSLVVRLQWPDGLRILVPGDLEQAGESRILERGPTPRAEILVAGHHGSVKSGSDAWLRAVGARAVLVACGGGRRAPHPEALRRLGRHALRVLRTDVRGTLILRDPDLFSGPPAGPIRRRRGRE